MELQKISYLFVNQYLQKGDFLFIGRSFVIFRVIILIYQGSNSNNFFNLPV